MTAILEERLEELCIAHDRVAIYVFGSRSDEIAARVRGGRATSERPESDVDIGVQPVRGRRLAAHERVGLMQALEAQLYYLRRAADLAPFLREAWSDRVGSAL